MNADTPSSPVSTDVARPDGTGRDGSPDRGGRPADGANAAEEFGSGGFGGYQGGNQADPQGGDAGGRADPRQRSDASAGGPRAGHQTA